MSTKKKAFITGANKGIGFGVAKELIAQGYDVWIGARNTDLGKKAAEEIGAHFIQLDVTDQKSVKAAFEEFQTANDTLDVLVNNAGVYLMGKDDVASRSSIESLKDTYDVNVFGVVSVSQTFLPILRKTKNSQILNVSSGMGSQNFLSDPNSFIADYPMMLAYCSSKAALNTFTILLAKELKPEGIRVNSMCPGYVNTELNGHSGILTTDQSAKNIVPFIMNEKSGTGKFAQVDGEYPW